MEHTNNGVQPEPEHFPLDEAVIALLAEIGQYQKQNEQQAIALGAQRNGVLVLFIRQHKLEGNWKVADNGRELIKDVTEQPVPARP
jgi:hypothetical protein